MQKDYSFWEQGHRRERILGTGKLPAKGRHHTDENRNHAKSVFYILNDLMGEIHGARLAGWKAMKNPEVFATRYAHWVERISIGAIFLALRKYDDFWTKLIVPRLLQDELPKEGVDLHTEITRRKIRKFCNIVVAHYGTKKESLKTSAERIEQLLLAQEFESNEELFLWTREVIEKIQIVRDRVAEEYGVGSHG